MIQPRWINMVAGSAIAFSVVGGASAAESQAWSGNTDEVRAIVAEMLADAETRTSLLQSGATAGHDGKFFLRSPDGNFLLTVGGELQFRYMLNFRDDNESSSQDDFESGFQTRRTALNFDGHVIDPNLFYRVTGNFASDAEENEDGDTVSSSSSGDFSLEDAYAGYAWDNGFKLRWGQFKLPYMREELVAEVYQLCVDKSLTNQIFNQGRSQGIEASYQAEDWRCAFAFSDGFHADNSEFSTDRTLNSNFFFASGESDYAFTGRAEIKFAGNWDQWKQFTSRSGSDFGALLGIAANYEGGDSSSIAVPTGLGSYSVFGATADVSLQGDGWNLFVAGVLNYSDFNGGYDGDDYGVVVQGGIFIPETDWEIFARFDIQFPDDSARGVTNTDSDTFSSVTAGVNYYWHGQMAKFTVDAVYYIDSFNALTVPQPAIGYLGDDNDGEFSLRFQFQLLF